MPELASAAVAADAVTNEIAPRRNRYASYACYFSVLLSLVFFGAVRFHFRNMPLERDEGEYAYMGQLILQGVAPYKIAYTMKLPGTCLAYAAMMAVFGQTAGGIRLGMIVVTTLCAILVFLLGKRLYGLVAGTIAGVTYPFLAIRPGVLGMDGHATHLVVLFALAGILLLLRSMEERKTVLFFASGLLFGLAFLMKQPGLLFAIFAGMYWLWHEWKRGTGWKGVAPGAAVFALAIAIPYALTCAWMLRAGVFANFWFWTWTYARAYGSIMSLSESWRLCLRWTLPWAVRPFVLWEIALAGLAAPLWSRYGRAYGGFVLGFFFTSLVAVSLGFYFRPHYFIMLLPVCALAVGIAVDCAQHEFRRLRWGRLSILPLLFFAVAYLASVRGQWESYFRLDAGELSKKFCSNGQACADHVSVADFINAHSSPQDQLGILGSEPEICFYTRLQCVGGYIYMYPLVEPQPYAKGMQADLMRNFESSRPRFIVYADNSWSWNWRPTFADNREFLEWAWKFAHSGYDLVDEVPVTDTGSETSALWGDRAMLYVFRRADSSGRR